jgi:hypothetical protein
MEQTGAIYGFRAMVGEAAMFATALPEAAKYWLTTEHMQPTFIHKFCNPQSIHGLVGTYWDDTAKTERAGWNRQIIYNNFFITKLSWWIQPKVRAWLLHLEQLRGFYKHR